MTDSQIIQYYTDLYENGQGTLSGLWYNIQTPLHFLFQKEEQLQVQEKRNQEQEKRIQEQNSDIVIWNTEYKQKEAALALFVKSFNSLKEEIIELKKQLDALKKEGRKGWFWWS